MRDDAEDTLVLRPRSAGEILDDAWNLALVDGPAIFVLVGLFVVPSFLALMILLTWTEDQKGFASLLLPSGATVLFMGTGLGSGAAQHWIRCRLTGIRPTLGICLRRSLRLALGHLLGRGLCLLLLIPGAAAVVGGVSLVARGSLEALILVGFGLFLTGTVLSLTSALHPTVASEEFTSPGAIQAALSREVRRAANRAVVAALTRVGLFGVALFNLHLLAEGLLWIVGHLGGLETARMALLLHFDNPVYLVSLSGLTLLLLAPFQEALNALIHLDSRIRHDGFDLMNRVRRLFPLTSLLLAGMILGTATPCPAQSLEQIHRAQAEVHRILGRVRQADPYLEGGSHARQLEALAKTFDTATPGGARWFRDLVAGFEARKQAGAVEVLEELDRRLTTLTESLTPHQDQSPRRERQQIRDLIPGVETEEGQPRPRDVPKKEPELKRPVRRDDVGEVQGPRGAGVLSAGVGGEGFALVGWLVLLGLALGVIAVAIFLLRNAHARDKTPLLPLTHNLPSEPEMPPTAEALEQQAEALARRGEFLEALRLVHRSALLHLHEAGMIAFERTRTNGEYARALRERQGIDDLTDFFLRLTRYVERHWYGQRACDQENYERGLALAEQLRRSVEGTK